MNEYKLLSQPMTNAAHVSETLNVLASEGWRVSSVSASRPSPLRGESALILLTRGSEVHLDSGGQVITLDYPVDPIPRYGYGQPAHPQLLSMFEAKRDQFREMLDRIESYRDDLLKIPAVPSNELSPSWINHWLAGLDASALYTFVADLNPKLYFEVGSGVSTRFVRRAIQDHGLRTRIRSIDPHPRVEVDSLCDEVIRTRLEDSDLELFDELEPGDILFIDSSHRSFMNSDVTVLFLDILPRLPAGVNLHIHDIRLPYDYPPEWGPRFYSEQYLLAVHLLAGGPGEILLSNAFISQDPELSHALDALWDEPALEGVQRHGESIWLRTGR